MAALDEPPPTDGLEPGRAYDRASFVAHGSIRRNVFAAWLGQWGRYVLQVIALVLLSRLLSPSDFGVTSMLAPVIAVAALVGDLGLSLAALQKPELSAAERTNLQWVNASVGLLVALATAAMAPVVASFYLEPRLIPCIMVLSVSFLLNGMALQFRTDLARESRFGALALVDVLSQAFGLCLAVVAALSGLGYWSLIAQIVSVSIVSLIGVAILSPWHPQLYQRSASIGSLVRFGTDTFWVQLVNFLSSNVDNAMIGRVSGTTVLGYYNRSFQLSLAPIQQVLSPLTRVMLPRLTRLATDPVSFARASTKLQALLCYSLLPVIGFVYIEAPALVRLLLGKQWMDVVPMLRILLIGAGFQLAGYSLYWLCLATARTRLLLFTELPGRILIILGVVMVASSGPLAVAYAVSVGQLVIFVVGLLVVPRGVGLRARDLLAVTLPPALSVLAATGIGVLVVSVALSGSLSLAGASALGFLTWSVVLLAPLLHPRPRRGVAQVLTELRVLSGG